MAGGRATRRRFGKKKKWWEKRKRSAAEEEKKLTVRWGVRRRLFFGNGRTEVGGRRCVGIRRRQVAQIRRSESTELGRDLGCSSLQICLSAVELDSGQEVMEMRNGGRNEEWGNEEWWS